MIDLSKIKPRHIKINNYIDCTKIDNIKQVSGTVWNIFDKIVCIHYIPYQDRLDKIKQELKRVGILDLPQFEFYETVDNFLYKYCIDGIQTERIDCSRINKFNINYTIDSYSLLKKLNFYGYERVLILEDDIVFHKDLDYVNKVIASTPDDFDVMNYDPEIFAISNETTGFYSTVNKYILKYDNCKVINMSCCALSKNAIQKIISKQLQKLRPFDMYTWIDSESLKTYCVQYGMNVCIQMPYDDRQTNKQLEQKYPIIDVGNYFGTKQEYDVIVSMTSHGSRLHGDDIYKVLKRLLEQDTSVRYHVVLTLFILDYKSLDEKLVHFCKDNGIEIIVSEYDYKSNLKYIFTMQKYCDLPVITVDDDMLYKRDMVQTLYDGYKNNRMMIHAARGRRILFNSSGQPMSYSSWELCGKNDVGLDIMATGCGGVLYPPEFCKHISLNIMRYVIEHELLTVDDIVLHCIAHKHSIMTKIVNSSCKLNNNDGFLVEKSLDSSVDQTALWRSNCSLNLNDKKLYLLDEKFKLDI